MLANKAFIGLGTFTVDLSEVAEVEAVPPKMRATLGPLAAINYKTAKFRYHFENAGAATGTVTLFAGSTEIGSGTLDDGSGAIEVDLAAVQGQSELAVTVDVTSAGNADARFTGRLDVEQPIVTSC